MIQYIRDLIYLPKSKEVVEKVVEDVTFETHPHKRYEGVDIIPADYDQSKITILLLEDFKSFMDVMMLELSEIISLDKVNIIKADTQYGAFNAILALDKINVDFAFCDITLGGMVFDGSSIKEYDGIDVFEKIMTNNPKAKVKLLTGHNLHSDNLEMTDAIHKFNTIVDTLNLHINIDDVYINKRSSRANMYYDLINAIGPDYDKISAK